MADSRLPERGGAQIFADSRGKLTLVQFDELSFDPTRAYVLDSIPVGGLRAGHASRAHHRLLLGISGRARVTLDNGHHTAELELTAGDTLQLPPGVWLEIEALEERTAMLVFADGDYDPGDIERDRSALPLTDSSAPQTSST